MKSLTSISLALIIGILSFACKDQKAQTPTLTIATAANMQFAMEELATRFTKHTGYPCELILGSSGKLTAQISAGAPFDLFVAANMKYPEEIFRRGLATSKPEVYATGKLVLWTMKENTTLSIASLTDDSISHIALANPRLAPYGQAAMEALSHYGLENSVKGKLVIGESIAQANQFITSGAAEIGFTALSVVVAPGMKGKGRWVLIDSTLYNPIQQGVVLIRNKSGPSVQAVKFYEFLFSQEAREVLKIFGYSGYEQP